MERRFNLCLDGVDYEVSVVETSRFSPLRMKEEKRFHVTVLDGQDSILRKLDNRPEITGNRFSDEYRFMDRDATYPVEMYWEEGLISFLEIDAESHEEAFNFVLNWIDDNFYRIEAIGWETLYKWRG